MLEAMEEQRLNEQPMSYESQLTALNASQQDFLASLARDKTPPFPFAAAALSAVGQGGLGSIHRQPSKEAMGPQVPPRSGEDTTLQQAAATLPIVGKPHPLPSVPSDHPTTDLQAQVPNDEKTGDLNVNITPQQEVQAPAVPPFPVNPMMMPPQQRPPGPYMFPMPMFYPPTAGFYPPSFPGMPGMPNMMMPHYGHHMISQMLQQQRQQQQQQQQQGGQQEETHESLEGSTSAPTVSAKLSPPPPIPLAPTHNPSSPKLLPPTAYSSSAGLESSSSTSVNNKVATAIDSIGNAESLPAVQAVEHELMPEAYVQNPAHVVSVTAKEKSDVMQTPPVTSTMLVQLQLEEQGGAEQVEVTNFPSATDIRNQFVLERQLENDPSEAKPTSTSGPNVNLSNPGE